MGCGEIAVAFEGGSEAGVDVFQGAAVLGCAVDELGYDGLDGSATSVCGFDEGRDSACFFGKAWELCHLDEERFREIEYLDPVAYTRPSVLVYLAQNLAPFRLIQKACRSALECLDDNRIAIRDEHFLVETKSVAIWAAESHEGSGAASMTDPGCVGGGGEHFVEGEEDCCRKGFGRHALFWVLNG